MTRTTRGAALALLLFMSAAVGVGCKKDKESLVLVDLKLASGAQAATGLKSVTLEATPGPKKTYVVSMLTADGVTLGLYIPGDITGDVAIVATAVPQSGCVGFRGNGIVTVDAPGVTRALAITMRADDMLCPPDGGTGGGAGGTAGSAGGTGGGTAGTGGGAAGTGGGAAGTGGGAAGTGGSGTAGTGGMGGGTGGMAGYPSISGCRTFHHCAGSCNTYVNAVAIAPNGQMVASGGDDGKVKIWSFDGRTLTATATLLTGFSGSGLAFSPDGTRLAYTSGKSVKTYAVSGWVAGTTLLNDGSDNNLVTVAFTPNGQRIVSVDGIGTAGGDVFAHEVGGNPIPAFTAHIARQPASMALSKVAASDGSVGVVVGTYNGTVAVLSLGDTGFTAPTVLNPSHPDAAVFAVRFSSDGSLVAMGDDYGVVRMWNYPITSATQTGGDIAFAGGDVINDIGFSPNGLYMAVGGGFSVAQLSIYNLATHAEVDRTTPAGDINSLVFSPSGGAIIAGEDTAGNVIVCN